MTGQLAVFGQRATDVKRVIAEGNASASTVFVMVENKEAVARVDQIAAVDGVDVVLVGSNDLAIELGVPSGFRTDEFRGALESVSRACRAHGKIMGLAGIYNQPDIQEWAIRELGVRYMLCQQDSGLIAAGAVKCAAEVSKLEG